MLERSLFFIATPRVVYGGDNHPDAWDPSKASAARTACSGHGRRRQFVGVSARTILNTPSPSKSNDKPNSILCFETKSSPLIIVWPPISFQSTICQHGAHPLHTEFLAGSLDSTSLHRGYACSRTSVGQATWRRRRRPRDAPGRGHVDDALARTGTDRRQRVCIAHRRRLRPHDHRLRPSKSIQT